MNRGMAIAEEARAGRSLDTPADAARAELARRNRVPARGDSQGYTVLAVKVPDLIGDYMADSMVSWCGHRVLIGVTFSGEEWLSPRCTRPAGHRGRHHAADGVDVYAVWGVRA